jgi:hypothetical protein
MGSYKPIGCWYGPVIGVLSSTAKVMVVKTGGVSKRCGIGYIAWFLRIEGEEKSRLGLRDSEVSLIRARGGSGRRGRARSFL